MEEQRSDFYHSFRERIKTWLERDGKANQWSRYILLAPDLLHLLCKLTVDPAVPMKEKAKLGAAIAYFVSPIDLLPEVITGPAGYVDDVALAAYVLNSILSSTDAAVVEKHWAGEQDLLDLVQQILKVSDRMVGSGLWSKLKGLVG